MKRALVLTAFLTVPSLAFAQAGEPLDPACETLLSAKAAEKLTGLSGLKLVGRNAVKFAGGTCNYVRAKGQEDQLLFLVTIDRGGGAEKNWPQRYGEKSMYRSKKKLTGMGDEAFSSMNAIVVKKGQDVLSIGAFVDFKTGKPLVAEDKVVAVAKDAVARL